MDCLIYIRARFALLAVALLLSGCSTPDLIRQSNEFVLLQLGELKGEVSKRLTTANKAVDGQKELLKNQYSVNKWLSNEASDALTLGAVGDSRIRVYYTNLQATADAIEKRGDALAAAELEYNQSMDAIQSKFSVPGSQFIAIETPLQTLAKDGRDFKDRLEFTVSFFKDVREEYKRRQEADQGGTGSEAAAEN